MTAKLFAAALMALAAACAQAAGWTRDWARLDSDHFTLYTKIDPSASGIYLKQLEAFRWLALQLLSADGSGARAKRRFQIYLLPGQLTLKAMFPSLPENTAGFYSVCADDEVAFGANMAEVGRNQDWTLIVLQHEYAHRLMAQYAKIAYPAWYVEGFAEFLSTAVYEDDRITLGAINEDRLRVLDHGGWMPGEELLSWQYLPGMKRSDTDRGSFYAESWLLAHYMLTDPERAKKLAAYFARVAAGEDPVAAFEPATGMRVDDLVHALSRYSRSMPVLTIPTTGMPAPAIQHQDLGADAQVYLADDSMLRCAEPDRGRQVLDRLRALGQHGTTIEPGLRLALARGEALFGDPKAALGLLPEELSSDEQRAEAHYLLGRAWMRQAESLAGDEQAGAYDSAKRELLQAYRLRKDDPPTLFHLAVVMARKGVDNNVLNAARGARWLAPWVSDYAMLEARLDLGAGAPAQALSALAPLASDMHNPEVAASARKAIDAIKAGKPADEVARLIQTKP